MGKTLEFFFDLGSPAAWLAFRRLPALCEAADATLHWRRAGKQRLKDDTQEAVARGVFGAPTFFVGGEMYWGQDRLDFVKEALEADTP